MVEGDKMTNIWSFKSERKHLYARSTYRSSSLRKRYHYEMSTDNAGASESTNSQNCQDKGHQAFTRHRNPIHELGRPSRWAVETRCQLHNSSSLAVKLVLVKVHKTEGQ